MILLKNFYRFLFKTNGKLFAICKKHCPRSGLDFIIFLFHNLFLNPRYSNSSLSIKIGQSLSIRRSFRNWLSEKLLLKDGDIKNLIS
jgi:hypothetical protein